MNHKTTTVESTFFKFLSWNIPNLQGVSSLVRFKFSSLLTKSLMKTAIFDKRYTKQQQKKHIETQIMFGEISVMKLNSKPIFQVKRNINKEK